MSKKNQKSALISVFNKDGIDNIAKKLSELNVNIISTGGTEKYLNEIGIKTEKVEKLTDYPSIFGGRVKTLHPKIFGGILYRRDSNNDNDEKDKFDIPVGGYTDTLEVFNDLVYFTSFNNDSIGSKWVSVFGNHDGQIFQNDQYLPDVDDDGNLNCINCPDSRQEGSVEWYELFNQSVLESPFQDGHFIYVVIPGSGSGDDVVAPRIIIADAENPLQFHKVLDL